MVYAARRKIATASAPRGFDSIHRRMGRAYHAPMLAWREVRAIDSNELAGVYATEHNVAAALETLRFGTDASDDDFAVAWNDALLGHVR